MLQRLIAKKRLLIIIFSIFLLAFRLKDLLPIEDHFTWDGPGHKVLLRIFIQLSSNFLAEGYVEDWFGGFPAFRFYPPFFSFLGAIPYWVGFDLDTSFRIAIILSIMVFISGYTYFVSYFLNPILTFSALFLYLSFQGDPTLAVSLPGVWGGNFPSLLGTGLAYFSIGSILRSNCFSNNFESKYLYFGLASISLLGYSHFLSFIFCYMLVFLYFLFQIKKIFHMESPKKWIVLLVIILPIFIAYPSLYGPIFNSIESSGDTLFSPYPFIETLLGFNHSSYRLTDLIVQPLRIIPGIFIIGIIFFKKKNSTDLFLVSSLVLLFFLCQDISISRIFYFTKIHFYRAWDLFLGFYFLIGVLGFSKLLNHFKIDYSIYAISLLSLLFLGYRYQSDPVDNSIYDYFNKSIQQINMKPTDHLLSEVTTSYPWSKSPHKVLSWIQEKGIYSQNGLMLESSWTPFVDRLYLPMQNEKDFVWGFQDPRRSFNLIMPKEELSLRYLHERKISHILTKTNSFRKNFSFLNKFNKNQYNLFEEIDNPIKILSTTNSENIESSYNNINKKEILGLVRISTTLGNTKKEVPQDFFLKSFNLLQDQNYKNFTFVDLDPYWREMQNSNFQHAVAGILIYNPENFSIVETIPIEKWKQNILNQNQNINFLTNDIQKNGNLIESDSDCYPVVFNQSYFPELELNLSQQTNKSLQFYRTQFNQTLVCLNQDQFNLVHLNSLYLPSFLGRIKFFGMIFTFLFWLVSSIFVYKKTSALGKL
jgi:hypothetical protein